MKRTIAAALLCFSAAAGAETYEECVLANMKGVVNNAAAGAITRACRAKTTPKQCQDAVLKKADDPFGLFIDQRRQDCIADCVQQSWWSRNFGDCST